MPESAGHWAEGFTGDRARAPRASLARVGQESVMSQERPGGGFQSLGDANAGTVRGRDGGEREMSAGARADTQRGHPATQDRARQLQRPPSSATWSASCRRPTRCWRACVAGRMSRSSKASSSSARTTCTAFFRQAPARGLCQAVSRLHLCVARLNDEVHGVGDTGGSAYSGRQRAPVAFTARLGSGTRTRLEACTRGGAGELARPA